MIGDENVRTFSNKGLSRESSDNVRLMKMVEETFSYQRDQFIWGSNERRMWVCLPYRTFLFFVQLRGETVSETGARVCELIRCCHQTSITTRTKFLSAKDFIITGFRPLAAEDPVITMRLAYRSTRKIAMCAFAKMDLSGFVSWYRQACDGPSVGEALHKQDHAHLSYRRQFLHSLPSLYSKPG